MTELVEVTQNDEILGKKPWLSKTLWVSLIFAIAPFVPPISAFIAAYPSAVGVAVSGVFAALRFMTKDKIGVK